MKKAMVYILALTLAGSMLLAGCGEMRGGDGSAAPAETPKVTVLPEEMMPDAADGEVRDRDGIITEGDNGSVNGGDKAKAADGTGKTDAGKPATGMTASGKR